VDAKAVVHGTAFLSTVVRVWLTAESAASELDTAVEKLEDGKVAIGIII